MGPIEYDANGNMTSEGGKCYEYNQANQLSTVKNCDSNQTIAEYVYDYKGQRIVKKNYSGGTLVNTVISWSNSFETKAIVGGATETTNYYFANNEVIAKKDNSGNKVYFHNDHLGSNALTTNQAGAQVEQVTYDPWGQVLGSATQSKYQYTGQEKDDETGLNYYDARYYDPELRRFTQPDTIIQDIYNPQSLNRYSYALNNPLKYIDPSGHVSILNYNNVLSNPSAQSYNNVLRQFAAIPGNKAPLGGFKPAPSSNSGGSNSGLRGSSSSGGSQGQNKQPDIFTLKDNIKTAESMKAFPLSIRMAWFTSMVRVGGPWDYKDQKRYGRYAGNYLDPDSKILYTGNENLGNVNYAMTGTALGIPSGVLYRAAGVEQQGATVANKVLGNPEVKTSGDPITCQNGCGDSFENGHSIDQEMITTGVDLYYHPW